MGDTETKPVGLSVGAALARVVSTQVDGGRICAWCRKPIPSVSAAGRARRVDSLTCSKRCRQAKARFRIEAAIQMGQERPFRLGYADPPYPGLARRYYGCEEVDHRALIARLMDECPDGWALSTSAEAVPLVLPMCPAKTRVCVWVRGARANPAAHRILNAWECVFVFGGRRPVTGVTDVLLGRKGRQWTHPDALVGMKPAAFCQWVFEMLGARQGDSLIDYFPGSGAVTRAWDLYVSSKGDTSSPGPRDA